MEDLISNWILPCKQNFSCLSMRLLSHEVAWVSCLVSNCKSSFGIPYFFFCHNYQICKLFKWHLRWLVAYLEWLCGLGVKPFFVQFIKITTFFLNPFFALSPWPSSYTSNKLKGNSIGKFYKYFHLLGTSLRHLHVNPYNASKMKKKLHN